jgi:hypothetical protein
VGTADVEHRNRQDGEVVTIADRPFCFILMPFGKKVDATGLAIDVN